MRQPSYSFFSLLAVKSMLMVNSTWKISLFILLVLSIFSCKKEETIVNYFEYEQIKYEIDEGIIESYGKINPEDPGYNYDISLFSTGIVFNSLEGSFSGSGNIIVLQMYSNLESNFSLGTYTFDSSGDKNPFTFDLGRFGLFVNMDEQSGTIILVNSGSIVISKDEDSWSFTFNCSTLAGNTITGSFSGSLDPYDVSGK